MQIADTLAFLLGDWSLERTLTDHRDGERGTFAGTGALRAAPAPQGDERRARYEERGRLRYRGYDGTAFRTLQFAAAAGSGTAAVSFSDGRPFFALDLRAGTCRAEHPCGPDLYELEFEVGEDGVVRERWRVAGPRKDYEALTTWRRVSRGP